MVPSIILLRRFYYIMEKAENRPKSFTFVNFLWLCYTNARGEVKL